MEQLITNTVFCIDTWSYVLPAYNGSPWELCNSLHFTALHGQHQCMHDVQKENLDWQHHEVHKCKKNGYCNYNTIYTYIHIKLTTSVSFVLISVLNKKEQDLCACVHTGPYEVLHQKYYFSTNIYIQYAWICYTWNIHNECIPCKECIYGWASP